MAKRHDEHPQYRDVTVTFGGKTWTGRYAIVAGMLEVTTAYGRKVAHIGRLPPQTLAEKLLRDIAVENQGE